jgi:hypothetical protein
MRTAWLTLPLVLCMTWSDTLLAQEEDPGSTPAEGGGFEGLAGLLEEEEDGPRPAAEEELPTGVMGYVKEPALFNTRPLRPEVAAGKVLSFVLGGTLAAVGGHLWGPKVALEGVPDNLDTARSKPLGIAATLTSFLYFVPLCCWVPLGLPLCVFTLVPVYGWVVGGVLLAAWSGLQCLCVGLPINGTTSFFNWWVFPRAILQAYSDGWDGPPPEPKKKAPTQRPARGRPGVLEDDD